MEFYCDTCGNLWKKKPDKDGLFDGYGIPRCPACGASGTRSDDYGDFVCQLCGKEYRRYGNGGLKFGCIPKCPDCGGPGRFA